MARPEDRLQKALVSQLRARLRPPWMFWHTPNSGLRRSLNPAAHGAYLKAMGQLPGMPDLFLAGPPRVIHSKTETGAVTAHPVPTVIALELKAPPAVGKRGPSKAAPRISEAQRDVINALGQCGIPTLIVRDLDEALRALSEMGVPLKGRSL